MQHNKKRNTGLVYEFLARYIAKSLIENQKSHANKAMLLVKKYFSSGPLSEELKLFNLVSNAKTENSQHAEKLLKAILEQASKMDHKLLERRKSALIHEINKTLDSSALYKSKIPYYPVYASLQTLINHSNKKLQRLDSVNKVQLEQRVLSFLALEKTPAKRLDEALKMDPTYNSTVYKLVIRKFDEKYKDSLNESQKTLLTKYAIASMANNKKVFSKALQNELKNIHEKLSWISNKEVRSDKELMKNISECRATTKEINSDNCSQEDLVKVLKLMSLAEEVSGE